jgi:hypothetical protein
VALDLFWLPRSYAAGIGQGRRVSNNEAKMCVRREDESRRLGSIAGLEFRPTLRGMSDVSQLLEYGGSKVVRY